MSRSSARAQPDSPQRLSLRTKAGLSSFSKRGSVREGVLTPLSRGELPLDAGCGWVHSADRNVLVPLIEDAGLALEKRAANWGRQSGDQGFSATEQKAFADAYEAFDARLAAAALKDVDAPASDFFEPGDRWNGLIDAVSSYYNGTEYDRVSVLDYAAYVDTGTNWRLKQGYGAAIAALTASIAPRFSCAVTAIDHRSVPVRLETEQGSLVARTVIVAVPTNLLAKERIVFAPGLPDKIEAAAGLPLGRAEKAFFYLDKPDELPVEGHFFGRIDRGDRILSCAPVWTPVYRGLSRWPQC